MNLGYVWLTDLDAALANAGVPFIEVPASPSDATGAASWRTRGRPVGTGDGFNPDGIVCHHTASPAGTPPSTDLRVILSGNSEAPGPIAQLYLGRDVQCYLVAAGRANHAGSGMRPGLDFTCTDMNARNVGIEVGNNGVGEVWSDPLCELYANVVAALCEWYGWPTSSVYLHNTVGPPSGGCNSKIDPAGSWTRQRNLTTQTWDLGTWRGFVDEHRGGAPPPDPGGDDVPFIGTPLIQSTGAGSMFGADGRQHPAWPGSVFLTDGSALTYRWLVTNQDVDDVVAMLKAAGLPTNIQPVDNMSAYGVCVGPVPGA
jgi:hypothetical protein